jgi:hypothetical protein
MGAPPSISQQLTTLPVLAKDSAAYCFGQYPVTKRDGLLSDRFRRTVPKPQGVRGSERASHDLLAQTCTSQGFHDDYGIADRGRCGAMVALGNEDAERVA